MSMFGDEWLMRDHKVHSFKRKGDAQKKNKTLKKKYGRAYEAQLYRQGTHYSVIEPLDLYRAQL